MKIETEAELKRTIYDKLNDQFEKKNLKKMGYKKFNSVWVNIFSSLGKQRSLKKLLKMLRPAKLKKSKQATAGKKKLSKDDKKWVNYIRSKLEIQQFRAMHIYKFIQSHNIDPHVVNWDALEGGDIDVEGRLMQIYGKPYSDVDIDEYEQSLMDQQVQEAESGWDPMGYVGDGEAPMWTNPKKPKIIPGQYSLDTFKSKKLTDFGDLGKTKGKGQLKGFALKDIEKEAEERHTGKGKQIKFSNVRRVLTNSIPKLPNGARKVKTLLTKRKPMAVIFDWDGTIVKYSTMKLIPGMKQAVEDFKKTHIIVYLTGNVGLTTSKIKQLGLPGGIIIKRENITKNVLRFKRMELGKLKEKYDITLYFDDDWANIQMAKKLGLSTKHMQARQNGFYKNPLQKAIQKFERFNYRVPQKVSIYDYTPPEKGNYTVEGTIIRMDYNSNKKIPIDNPDGDWVYFYHDIEKHFPKLGKNKKDGTYYCLGSQFANPEGLVSKRHDKKYIGKIPNIDNDTYFFEIGKLARVDYIDDNDGNEYTLTFNNHKLVSDDTARFCFFVDASNKKKVKKIR